MNFNYSDHKKAYKYLMLSVLFAYFGFSYDNTNFIPAYLKFGAAITVFILAIIEFWKTSKTDNSK